MKTANTLLGFSLVQTLAILAHASPIFNGDFELALTDNAVDPYFNFLSWEEASPGWGHSSGIGLGHVLYPNPHVGVNPWYWLIGNENSGYGLPTPLEGNFSLSIRSGIDYSPSDPYNAPWIQAFISQTISLPNNAHQIQLLADGKFSVSFNEHLITMAPLGGFSFSGDISGFAGQTGELKISHSITEEGLAPGDYHVVVDGIHITTVPEPMTTTLLLLGGLFLLAKRRNARTRGSPGVSRPWA